MITQPQIFVIFEPGLFGRTVCTVLTKDTEFKSDEAGINNHNSSYKPVLDNFHWHREAVALLQKTHEELKTFFSGVNNKNAYSVHNLASYKFAEIPYQKFFSRYLKIILMPKRDCLRSFAERVYEAHITKNAETDYYMKYIKKDLSKVPEYFLKGMAINEKYKYMCEHFDRLQEIKTTLPTNNTLFFDPLDLFDLTKFQNLIDECTHRLDIGSINLPKLKLQTFLEKNKSFFDKHLNS